MHTLASGDIPLQHLLQPYHVQFRHALGMMLTDMIKTERGGTGAVGCVICGNGAVGRRVSQLIP